MVHEAVIEFCSIFNELIEQGWTKNEISIEVGLSMVAILSLLGEERENNPRASTIGKVQDFIKRHKNYNYDNILERFKTHVEDEEIVSESDKNDFWGFINRAMEIKPDNVDVKIIVKSKT